MTKTAPTINENERKVLEVLAEEWSSDMNCFYFRGIVSRTKLELKVVRRACRSLAKKGYAQYVRGLFNEDGETAGSGYCATFEGALLLNACKKCKKKIADMVTGECQACWEVMERGRRFVELERMGVPTIAIDYAGVSLCDIEILKKHYEKNGIPAKLRPEGALAQVNRLVKQYQRHYTV